ncbi:hypothetical protein MUK42_26861 [Musa troglodytarum]|uniref:Uncharacterized protein n=1 Tax=Musa troglodytarum TaxID=320322 RepID=A0A9E7F9W0_9LILI|nr:hypothetical protein MUK42_26861 [Musa troglodytarum]
MYQEDAPDILYIPRRRRRPSVAPASTPPPQSPASVEPSLLGFVRGNLGSGRLLGGGDFEYTDCRKSMHLLSFSSTSTLTSLWSGSREASAMAFAFGSLVGVTDWHLGFLLFC